MIGVIFGRMLVSLGLKKAPPAPRQSVPPAKDDFIARYGLSYGESPDLMTEEQRIEVERLKTVRPPRR